MKTIENVIALISLKRTILETYTVPSDLRTQSIDAELLTGTYIISLINMSSNCLTISGTRRIGGSDAEWKWTPIPKICKNCTTTFQQCFKESRFSPIMTTDCSSQPFELFVGYFISDNEVKGTIFDISPNCSYAGGVIGVTD